MINNKNKIFEHPEIKNFCIEIKTKYHKENNQKLVKEWNTTTIPQNCLSYLSKYQTNKTEILVKFTHIDDDNPEFFLQSGQIINILQGEIIIENNLIPIMLIHKFRQIDDEDRTKFQNQKQ